MTGRKTFWDLLKWLETTCRGSWWKQKMKNSCRIWETRISHGRSLRVGRRNSRAHKQVRFTEAVQCAVPASITKFRLFRPISTLVIIVQYWFMWQKDNRKLRKSIFGSVTAPYQTLCIPNKSKSEQIQIQTSSWFEVVKEFQGCWACKEIIFINLFCRTVRCSCSTQTNVKMCRHLSDHSHQYSTGAPTGCNKALWYHYVCFPLTQPANLFMENTHRVSVAAESALNLLFLCFRWKQTHVKPRWTTITRTS